MARESDLLLWDGSRGSGFILKVRMQKGLVDAYQGASIAINGVCLTVLEWPVKDGVVSFGVAPETIKLTNLVRASISQYRAATRLTPRPYFCNLGDPLAPG
jgi:riboflavin synthase alpha subunit